MPLFSGGFMFATYVFALVVAGVLLVGLSASVRELGIGRRIRDGVIGIACLGYAAYLVFAYFVGSTGTYSVFWVVFVLPALLVFDSIRRIDLSDVEPPRFDEDDEPLESEHRRSTASQARRAARRAAQLATIRDKRGEAD